MDHIEAEQDWDVQARLFNGKMLQVIDPDCIREEQERAHFA
jgi:hypothetical protein